MLQPQERKYSPIGGQHGSPFRHVNQCFWGWSQSYFLSHSTLIWAWREEWICELHFLILSSLMKEALSFNWHPIEEVSFFLALLIGKLLKTKETIRNSYYCTEVNHESNDQERIAAMTRATQEDGRIRVTARAIYFFGLSAPLLADKTTEKHCAHPFSSESWIIGLKDCLFGCNT